MKYNFPKNIFLLVLVSLLMNGVLLPTKAFCRLSAEAELDYVNYDVRDNNNQHLSAHSLSQRYSLLYETAGKFVDGRLGKYNLALGYDWSTFDTTIKSTAGAPENPSASRGHILYRGEILIDPKEIPLRLTAYSRDMNRVIFTEDFSNLLGTTTSNSLTGPPRLATGIIDGLHIESGATLVMGVKNGMTNGYNEFLRHFPMLMLDYRDSINRDLRSNSPVDNRLNRLAFVSLNKKDNWLHYRVITFNDYINPGNNYKETQIQLGTIDQTQQRRWIDFSNWLQVSADGQLTRRTNGATASSISSISSTSASVPDSFTEFDLNLFGIAQRSSWEARTFNNFNRIKEDTGRITYRTTAPIYANGVLSADTSWNTRFSYKEDHDNQNNKFEDISGGYRIDTFKRSSFILSQQLDLEKATSNSVDLLTVSGALETTSTARFSRLISLGASYNFRNFTYESATKSNMFDQSLRATATYSPSNQIRYTLSQTTQLTNGTPQTFNSSLLGATVVTAQYSDPRNNTSISSSSFHSITDLSLYWNPLARLNIGFSINEDIFLPRNNPRSYRTNFSQTADYSGTNFKLTSTNALSVDSVEQTTSTNTFISNNRADYTFNRNLDSNVSLSYYKALSNTNESNTLSIGQGLNYYYYRTSGVTRKLLEINESYEYTENSSNNAASNIANSPNVLSTPNSSISFNRSGKRISSLTLGAKYFPVRQLLLAAGSRYSFFNSFNDYSLTYYGSIGLNYRLLQASLDYMYGTNRSDGRIEKKVTANFKKSF